MAIPSRFCLRRRQYPRATILRRVVVTDPRNPRSPIFEDRVDSSRYLSLMAGRRAAEPLLHLVPRAIVPAPRDGRRVRIDDVRAAEQHGASVTLPREKVGACEPAGLPRQARSCVTVQASRAIGERFGRRKNRR